MSDADLIQRLRTRHWAARPLKATDSVLDAACALFEEAADAIARLTRERDEALRRCAVAEANAEADAGFTQASDKRALAAERERDLLRQRADHSLSPELLQQVNLERSARLAAERDRDEVQERQWRAEGRAHTLGGKYREWMERALAAEARAAKLRELLKAVHHGGAFSRRVAEAHGASDVSACIDKATWDAICAALATEGEPMPVEKDPDEYMSVLAKNHTKSATVPAAPRPDPEAVELAERLDQYYSGTAMSYDVGPLIRRAAACLRRLGGVE